MKIKNILIILLLIFITSCNKYEYVNDETRFNKHSGEIEKLSSKGEWNSLEKKLKENEKQRLRLIELKKERTRQRDRSLSLLGWSLDDSKDIQYVSNSRVGDEQISIKLINNSDYEIEMISTKVELFNVFDGDSTLVSTTKDTLILDVDGTKGLSGNGEETYCCFDFPDTGDNQEMNWSLSIRGWEGF
mgnify:CR=1 FL=1